MELKCCSKISYQGKVYRICRWWNAIIQQSISTVQAPVQRFEAEAHVNNILEFSRYRKENATLHHYKDQLVNAVWGNNRCLLWESYEIRKYKLKSYLLLKRVVHIVTTGLKGLKFIYSIVLVIPDQPERGRWEPVHRSDLLCWEFAKNSLLSLCFGVGADGTKGFA
jgi:hypothetical protein